MFAPLDFKGSANIFGGKTFAASCSKALVMVQEKRDVQLESSKLVKGGGGAGEGGGGEGGGGMGGSWGRGLYAVSLACNVSSVRRS